MAIDQFLHIDGIKGESTDSQHKDWIEVLSYSQGAGASAPGTADAKKTSGPSEILITKKVDSSSPLLQRFCASGKHFPQVTLDVVRPGVKPETAEMSDVVIANVSPQVSPHDKATDVPTESITLNYGKIQWTYTQQK
jgi:type VI secretion system secreted protein Hcp